MFSDSSQSFYFSPYPWEVGEEPLLGFEAEQVAKGPREVSLIGSEPRDFLIWSLLKEASKSIFFTCVFSGCAADIQETLIFFFFNWKPERYQRRMGHIEDSILKVVSYVGVWCGQQLLVERWEKRASLLSLYNFRYQLSSFSLKAVSKNVSFVVLLILWNVMWLM